MAQLEFGLGGLEDRTEGVKPARPRATTRTKATPPAEEDARPRDPTAPSALQLEDLDPSPALTTHLEATLRARLGPKVLVQLHKNRTTMLSFKRRRGVTYLRLHALFAHAPGPVLDAIADYLEAPSPPAEATRRIDHFLEMHRDLVEANRAEQVSVQPEGRHHDLGSILEQLNRELFAGRLTARITWSKAARGQRRSSMRLGSYNESENLIRIHPALDQSWVPRYFVASVVFHEMLHEVHGAEHISADKRAVHTPAFLADERTFPDHERAKLWERKNLARLLRY